MPSISMYPGKWQIQLLGGIAARYGATTVERFLSTKAAHLFCRLAFRAGRRQPRDELVELIWPEDDPAAGRSRLRVLLTSLRRQLEPPGTAAGTVICADRSYVWLNTAAVDVDVLEFRENLTAGARASGTATRAERLAAAVDLYRGELMPGFYEDWILAERRSLHEAYIAALRSLTHLEAEQGNCQGAVAYARLALGADPVREESCAELMKLLAASGEPGAARAVFSDFAVRLEAELGEAPSAWLGQLATTIGTDPVPPAARPFHAIAAQSELVATPAAFQTGREPSTPVVLPSTVTRFFGRDEERIAIAALLGADPCDGPPSSAARLVTLTGAGGAGKTRLAVEVARSTAGFFAGGVYFIPLADVADASIAAVGIADGLGAPPSTDVSPIDRIVTYLCLQRSRGPTLLVLDNYEQIADRAAELVALLIDRLPQVRVIVTSRRALGIPGEREFPVGPLPMPSLPPGAVAGATASDGGLSAETVAASPAVQLFIDRAQAVRPDFQVTDRNARDLASICRRLDGMPLAIELAAARVRVLSPAQMAAELTGRYDLLVNRNAVKDDRHRSLRAAIDWSYQLLTPAMQRAFAQLSIFAGGWTLEAAQTVCDLGDAVDVLGQLQSDSLVAVEDRDDGVRFRLLETIRAFAAERLARDDAMSLWKRHARFFRDLVETAERELQTPEQAAALRRIDADLDNVRTAMERSIELDDAETALRLGGSLWRYWQIRGHLHEGRERLKAVLAATRDAPLPGPRARALTTAGTLALSMGDYASARDFYEEGLAIRRAMDHTEGIIASLNNLGTVYQEQGERERAAELYRDALELSRQIGADWRTAGCLNSLGALLLEVRDYAAAEKMLEEALTIRRRLGDRLVITTTLVNLAGVRLAMGQPEWAGELAAEALRHASALADVRGVGLALHRVAQARLGLGDTAGARQAIDEAVDMWRRIPNRLGLIVAAEIQAAVCAAQGQATSATRLWGCAERCREIIGVPASDTDSDWEAQYTAMARAALGQDFDRELRVGADLDLMDVFANARAASREAPR